MPQGVEGGGGLCMKWRTTLVMAFILIGFLVIPAFSRQATAGGLVRIQTGGEELLGAPQFAGLSELQGGTPCRAVPR